MSIPPKKQIRMRSSLLAFLLFVCTALYATALCEPCELSNCSWERQQCTANSTCICKTRYRGESCQFTREKMRVFITERVYNSSEFGGARGADRECQSLAPLSLRNKVWRAWLQGDDRREYSASGYQYLDLTRSLVARTWPPDQLLDSIGGNFTEFWIGSPNHTCSDWTTRVELLPPNETGAYGTNSPLNRTWNATGVSDCSASKSLLCVQQEDYESPCESDPCANNAACLTHHSNHSYECICRPGFAGDRCQTEIDNCASAPCQNGATCATSPLGFHCNCAPGFNGTLCEIDVDECLSAPCVNGTCVNSFGNFSCECNPGWSGARCQNETNECASQPCRNGATCTDLLNGYSCQCALGFSGTRCQVDINDCLEGSCPEHAFCLDGLGNFTCQCAAGYSGPQCQNYTNICVVDNPCKNGGFCTPGSVFGPTPVLLYSCECQAGWLGTNCTTPDPCLVNPCQNGAGCAWTPLTDPPYTCSCAVGYGGQNCTDCDLLHANTCNGTCTLKSSLTDCGSCGNVCPESTVCATSGPNLNFSCITDPCSPSPCHGGTCSRNSEASGGYTCDCSSTYGSGTNCTVCFPGISGNCDGSGICSALSSNSQCGTCSNMCSGGNFCTWTGEGYGCTTLG